MPQARERKRTVTVACADCNPPYVPTVLLYIYMENELSRMQCIYVRQNIILAQSPIGRAYLAKNLHDTGCTHCPEMFKPATMTVCTTEMSVSFSMSLHAAPTVLIEASISHRSGRRPARAAPATSLSTLYLGRRLRLEPASYTTALKHVMLSFICCAVA